MEELGTLESFFWGFCGNAATEGDDSENRGAADFFKQR